MRALKLLAAVAIAAGIVATAGSQTAQPGGNAYVPGGAGGGVTQIVAGTGISLSPVGGTGAVTVMNTGSAPAFSAITSGTNSTAAMVVGTGASLSSVPAIDVNQTTAVSTNADGLLLSNSTAATGSGVTAYSPSLHLQGHGWSGSASVSNDWLIYNLPSGTNGTFLVFSYSFNGGSYDSGVSFNQNSVIGAAGFSPNANNTAAGCTSCYYETAANSPAIAAGNTQVMGFTTGTVKTLVPLVSAGTTFAFASGTGACATTSTLVGGAQAGHLTCTGTTGASTVTLTLAATTTSWSCVGRDITTPTTVTQTGALSTTAITLTFTSVSASDVVEFHCLGY
jgi:hypothetical protein